MNYDLSHLTQGPDQRVMGPIQDDEALLLYAICRVCQYTRVIEFGGLHGYSATNFLRAMGDEGAVWSVDCDPIRTVSPRHYHVHKEAGSIERSDFGGLLQADLVFFDVHDLYQQLRALRILIDGGIVHNDTLLVFHDTGLHPDKRTEWSVPCPSGGFIHQQVERDMVDNLRDQGWEAVEFSCPRPKPPLEYRHGLVLMKMRGTFERATPDNQYTVCRPGVKIG